MLEIVEREAFGLSGCLALGESFYAAMPGSIFFRGGGLALVESLTSRKSEAAELLG